MEHAVLLTGIMALFLLATLVQLFFWGVLFRRLTAKKHTSSILPHTPPLSVIICARNEAENLAVRLPTLLSQRYPDFELILVDHASTDNTAQVLAQLAAQFPKLRVLHCEDPSAGKKAPLAQGIRAARHEWIVLTDADCRATSMNWLRHIANQIDCNAALVLGYGPLEKRPGFLNAFARFETIITAIQYFSYAIAGKPYMGVGRNLAYRRSALPQALFSAHNDLPSGDDDLLVNAIAQSHNTRILLQPESFMWSPAPDKWTSFFRQKSRHLTTSPRYKPVHKVWLTTWALSFLGHYGLGLLALFSGKFWLVLLAYLVRISLIFLIFNPISRKLKAPDLLWKLPILDCSLFFYYLFMAPSIWWGSRKKWR